MLTEHGAPARAIAAHLLHTEPAGEESVVAALAAEGRGALAAGSSPPRPTGGPQ
jgi:hypothetical protein